eukprot:3805542-Heterocapsa_arctica.AAC.1
MTPAGEAPKDWFVGQQTPASYTKQGIVDKWRLIEVGERRPWDSRVAKCTKQEYMMNKALSGKYEQSS